MYYNTEEMGQTSLKETVAGMLFIGMSVATFWLWHKIVPAIIGGETTIYGFFILPVAGLVLSAVLFAFAAIFIKTRAIAIAAALIGAGAPFFFVQATLSSLIVLGASLLLALYARHRIHWEYLHSLGFSVSKILKSGLPIYFSITALTVSIFYFSLIDEKEALSSLLPQPALDFALKTFSGPIQSLTGLPEINPDETVDDLLTKLVVAQAKSQGVLISKIPKSEFERSRTTLLAQLFQNYNIKLSGKERIGDVLYKTITERAEDLLGPYKTYLPFVSVIGFFLAFKTLTWPLYYLTLIILFMVVRLATAAHIVRKEKQQIEVEKLLL